MTQPATIAVIGALVYEHDQLFPIFAAYVDEGDGEVLPHPILSEIAQWTADNVDTHAETVRSIWRFLSDAFLRGDDAVQELIAVSGVEMLPGLHTAGGAAVRAMLPAHLLELDPWRTR